MARAEEPHVPPAGSGAHRLHERLQAGTGHVGGNAQLPGQPRGRRAVARREDEGVGVGEADLAHGAQRLVEFLVRLAGEADDDVGGERHTRNRPANAVDAVEVAFARVAAQHALEHARRPALHRQVHVLADGRHLGHRLNDAVAEVVGVRARVAHAADARHRPHSAEKVGEVVRAVGVGVDRLPEQHDLAHPRVDDLARLAHHFVEPAAALGAARRGDDAVGAPVVAAALHGDPRLDLVEPSGGEVLVVFFEVEARGDRLLAAPRAVHELRQGTIAVRTDDERDVPRLFQQQGTEALGHAARDSHDAVLRHVPLELTQPPDDPLLRMIADGAGVDQNDVGAVRLVDGEVAGGGELAEHQLGVAHVHLATVRLDVDGRGGLIHPSKISVREGARWTGV